MTYALKIIIKILLAAAVIILGSIALGFTIGYFGSMFIIYLAGLF